MEAELRNEISILHEKVRDLEAKFVNFKVEMLQMFNSVTEKIQEVTMNAHISDLVYEVGNGILAEKLSGITPGGAINAIGKEKIAESIEEPTEVVDVETETEIATPVISTEAEIDPMMNYFVDNWMKGTAFVLGTSTKLPTFKSLFTNTLRDEFIELAKKDKINTNFDFVNANPELLKLVYRYCKMSNSGPEDAKLIRYYRFIVKAFEGTIAVGKSS